MKPKRIIEYHRHLCFTGNDNVRICSVTTTGRSITTTISSATVVMRLLTTVRSSLSGTVNGNFPYNTHFQNASSTHN